MILIKHIILTPNNVVPPKQLWLQRGCRATHRKHTENKTSHSIFSAFINPALDSFYRPTNRWHKDGTQLSEKSYKINNKDRTLTLSDASPDDNGVYYCCAKNAAGHVCSSNNFTLNIIGVCVSHCVFGCILEPQVLFCRDTPNVRQPPFQCSAE